MQTLHPRPLTRRAVLVGETGVGKSSLLVRFTEGTFEPDALATTIGVDFKLKMMRLGRKMCKVTIWDTAGQERFRTLTSSYYRGAHGIILVRGMDDHAPGRTRRTRPHVHAPLAPRQVYDVTKPDTFRNLNTWLTEVEMYCPNGGKDVVKLLVGNKTDKVSDRAVSTKEGEAWARSKGMLFLESSATRQDEVNSVFEEVVQKILDNPALLAGTAPASGVRTSTLPKLGEAPRPPGGAAGGAGASAGGGCCG